MQINRNSDFRKSQDTLSADSLLADNDLFSSPTQRILVVTRSSHMSEAVMNYATNVADRLGYSILALYVNSLPFFRDGGGRGHRFGTAVEKNAQQFAERAKAKNVGFSRIIETGKVGPVVQRLCQAARRIEFIVIDQNLRSKDVSSKSPVPVFSVVSSATGGRQERTGIKTKHFWKGDLTMSTQSKARYAKKALVFGVGAVALYAAVFANADLLMSYCTKGGVFAVVPVATVFLFSYVHGSFTSAFWSALGIEGSQKVTQKSAEKTAKKAVRKDTRPRAQVQA